MRYIKGKNRNQPQLMPDCIENYASEDNPVRVIDAFVEALNMEQAGFKRAKAADTGRPPYDPRDLLSALPVM